jgi:hypothetical protein
MEEREARSKEVFNTKDKNNISILTSLLGC